MKDTYKGAGIVIAALAICMLGYVGVDQYNKHKTPAANPQLVQQYQALAGEFQYLNKMEVKKIDAIVKAQSTLCPEITSLQNEIKDIQAQKKNLQGQVNKLVQAANKAAKGN